MPMKCILRRDQIIRIDNRRIEQLDTRWLNETISKTR
jgi:hypothetical protein